MGQENLPNLAKKVFSLSPRVSMEYFGEEDDKNDFYFYLINLSSLVILISNLVLNIFLIFHG